MQSDIKPYGQRVKAEPVGDSNERRTNSGLHVVATEDRHVRKAVVTEVGDDVPHLEAGCVIYYAKGHGFEIGDAYIVNADAIIAWEPA